jgi:hypothetical protein
VRGQLCACMRPRARPAPAAVSAPAGCRRDPARGPSRRGRSPARSACGARGSTNRKRSRRAAGRRSPSSSRAARR